MRTLVTGAAGFVGARAVSRLAELGMSVRALVRRGLVSAPTASAGALVRGDVTDPASLRAAMGGCDVVFHCAWGGYTLDEARRINVDGTRHVVEAAAAAGVRRIVHVSTMAVHGRKLPRVLTEDCPFQLRGDAYGVSKAEGEMVAFERGRALGIEVTALRPTLVYGPRAPLWVLAYFERVRNEQVALIDAGQGLANLVYVDDLIDAMLLAAREPAAAGEAFLVSGDHPITWREYLGHFASMCGKPLPPSVSSWRARIEMQWLRVYGTLAQRPRRLVGMDLDLMTEHTTVSIDKARQQIGYSPRFSVEDGMRQCAIWLRHEGHLPLRNGASHLGRAAQGVPPEPMRARA